MKRKLVASILGIAASAAASYGQGVILFGNYSGLPTQTQVTWGNSTANPFAAGVAVDDPGAVISLWAGTGILSSSSSLTLIATTPLFTTSSGAGWYSMASSGINGGQASIPSSIFTGSQTVTFQVRGQGVGADASATGASALWQETPSSAGGSLSAGPAAEMQNGPQHLDLNMPVGVPEPTTFALLGLGAAGLMFFRRKN